jgi:hypothetical protein
MLGSPADRHASWRPAAALGRRPATRASRPGQGADRQVPPLRMDRAAHRARDLLGVRDGRPAMSAALRIEAAAEATTGEVLPAHVHPDGQLSHHRQTERASRAGISVRTQRKLDRLARVRPDLLTEVRAGRMSAHRAALEAGIVGQATEDERAGSSDAPDRPPWRTVREALDSLVSCPVPVEQLARTIPLHRADRMAANARKAITLLSTLADRLERRGR